MTVVIVGLSKSNKPNKRLIHVSQSDEQSEKLVSNIGPYLVASENVIITGMNGPIDRRSQMVRGNMPYDGGHLLLSMEQLNRSGLTSDQREKFIRIIYGSSEFVRGSVRYCIWISDEDLHEALQIPFFRNG